MVATQRTFAIASAFMAALVLAWVGPVLAQDNESYHHLEELKLRAGVKPYERMIAGAAFPSERTVFFDSITGVEVWKMTNDPAVVRHEYYDIPVWNRDGSWMLVLHQGGVLPNPNWLIGADGGLLQTLPESSVVDYKWSWLDADDFYAIDGSEIVRLTWPTWTIEPLFDFETVTPPFDIDRLSQVPSHPADDRLLFHTRELGRFFSFDVDLDQLTEVPTDGRWAVVDGIHRLRWTRDTDHNMFFGQNWVLNGGTPTFDRRQFIIPMAGAFDPLDECMLPGVADRTKHPDMSMDGLAVTGFIEHDFWVFYCGGEETSRTLYEAEKNHHGSNSYDDRWYVIDNSADLDNYTVGGLDASDSNVLLSLDGRAQMILNYHYSLQAEFDGHTEPRPASSPDGTKYAFDSNMMNRGVVGAEGNSDVYVTVVRRPFPPTDIDAVAGQGDVRITWSRPLHSPDGLHWNPGNLSREIAGYHVWRAEQSGGPYTQITDSPVADTLYSDVTAIPDTVYYYVIQSVEPSGLGSVFSAEEAASTSVSSWQGSVRHHYEAELATVELPYVPQLGTEGASGEWFVGTFAVEPDPVHPLEPLPAAVTFSVRAPLPSTYYLWLRLRSFGGATSTFDVDLDSVSLGSVDVSDDAWTWVPLPGSFSMATGDHDLAVSTIDLEAGIDLIAVTDDPSYVPAGRAGNDTTAPAPPSNTRLVAIDGTTKKLLWDAPPDNDVQYYNVYCGRDDTYALANPNRLYSPTDTVVWDWGIPASTTTVYKVTAVDRFGNESAPAVHDPAVSGEGSAPVSFDDVYNIDEDTVLAPGGLGVLENDLDLDDDILSASLVEDVADGTLDLAADGSFVYTPAANWSGTDSFVYLASDGLALSLEATVTITVAPVNDPPLTVVDSYTSDEDLPLIRTRMTGVLANDSDVEDDSLTALLVSDASHGTVTLNADGSFDYDPEPNFNGSDGFTYEAFDGTDSSGVTVVAITVNPVDDAPDAFADGYNVVEDGQLVIDAPGVLDNDVEFDGESLSAVLDEDVVNGTLSLNSNGRFVYTPNPDFAGVDRFYYRANDGISDSNVVVVTITVDEVNDLPVAQDDAYAGVEDSPVLANAGVLLNDSDVETGNLDAVLLTEPAVGLVIFDSATGDFIYYPERNWSGVASFTYAATDGEDQSVPATVTITIDPVNDTVRLRNRGYTIDEDEVLSVTAPGLLARVRDPDGDPLTVELDQDVNRGVLDLNADGSFVYTPELHHSGSITFRVRANDTHELSLPTTIKITVVSVPDAPTGVADAYTAAQDTELSVPAPTGVLTNDSDGDGDPITAELLDAPAHGTLTEFKPGGRFDYEPAPGFVGEDTFTYRATDGELLSEPVTVTITVEPSTGPRIRRGRGGPRRMGRRRAS